MQLAVLAKRKPLRNGDFRKNTCFAEKSEFASSGRNWPAFCRRFLGPVSLKLLGFGHPGYRQQYQF